VEMTRFPSGSRMSAMWQTPVSNVSMSNVTPCSSSSRRASATSATRSANPDWLGVNGMP
jgi:hypothetical protein